MSRFDSSHLHERIIRFYTIENISVTNIVKILKTTTVIVVRALKKAGVYKTRKDIREERLQRIKELHEKGLSITQISIAVQTSYNSVKEELKELGLEVEQYVREDLNEMSKISFAISEYRKSRSKKSFESRKYLKKNDWNKD